MNAEIISVGTELLLGDVINTNATYIAKELAILGINCYAQVVVGDNPKRLKQTFTLSAERSEFVIITGGLGPTYDDLTKETIAQYFDKTLQLNQEVLADIEAIFKKHHREMSPNNKKQAMIPEGAIILDNSAGTAPGIIIEGDHTTAILLPGPPREMKTMFAEKVKPYLQQFSETTLVSRTVHLLGIGESAVELILHDEMLAMTNPTIAPYAKEGEMYLRITASAENEQTAEQLILPIIEKVKYLFAPYIYGIDVPSLQVAVLEKLYKNQKTLTVVEDITGGMLLNLLHENMLGMEHVFGQVQAIVEDKTDDNILNQAKMYQQQMQTDYMLLLLGDIDENQHIKPIFTFVMITAEDIEIEKCEIGFGYEQEYNRLRYLAALKALHFILQYC